jgi:serine/threonine-protein kinase
MTVESSANTKIADPLVGRILDGRYRIEDRIARGGMATVYAATDLRLDRYVAIKVMHASLAEDSAFVSRFVREAKSAARLSDPHVVAVYDQGEDSGLIYLVMEFVPGRTVRDVLREFGRLSPEQALTILDPVLQALDAAHAAGFVHRDVKPENVLLTDDGRVKVADFGLARAISAGNATAATQGLLIGTVAYLSPEQVQRGIADARSDVYGAGILLYEMITGSVPFAGETPLAVAYQHVNAVVPVPSSVRPGIPAEVDALVARATERDPDLRYPNAASFLADLRRIRSGLPAPRPFGVGESNASTLIVPLAGLQTGPIVHNSLDAPPTLVAAPRKKRKGLITFIVFAVIAALVAGAAWYLGVGKKVTVPSVSGLTAAAAQAKLKPLNLALSIGGQQFSETIPSGHIISTNPQAGTDVRDGSTIAAIVSKGLERYAIPQVAGMSVADATAAITDSSLTVGGQTTAYDEKIAKGKVIGTNPPANQKLKRDQQVTLIVSKGPAPVPVPNLVGRSLSSAEKSLTNIGLEYSVTREYSKSVPTGHVISTDPKAGEKANRGDSVSLVVSKGPPLITVPDLYKTAEADARATLEGLGFKVTVTYPLGISPFGRVVRQSEPVGTQLPWGSTISIDVV